MKQVLSHPPVIPTSKTSVWMLDRLTEARGILAETTHHPDSLVILAARVIVGQTECASECADAVDLLWQMDRRPLHAIAAAAFPNGGAA